MTLFKRRFHGKMLPSRCLVVFWGNSRGQDFELATFRAKMTEPELLSGLKWLVFFSDRNITPKGNPLDTLCATLEELMQYEQGERGLVCLQHKFGIEWADGTTETRTSTLVDPYGYSSLSGGVRGCTADSRWNWIRLDCWPPVLDLKSTTQSWRRWRKITTSTWLKKTV